MSEKIEADAKSEDKQEPKPAQDEVSATTIELLKAELRITKDQLAKMKEAHDRIIAEQKAREEAERKELIDRIVIFSDGKYSEDRLRGKSKQQLQEILHTINLVREDSYAGIAAYYDMKERKAKPLFTVGYWDSKSNSWKGGIDTNGN